MTGQCLDGMKVKDDKRQVVRPMGRRGLLKGALAASVVGVAPFNILKAGPFSEIVLLGDVAITQPGRKLLWDSKKMRITNDEAANKSTFMRRLAPRDDMKWI